MNTQVYIYWNGAHWVVRWNVARTFEGLARWRGALALRAVRLANIVAFACITCARRLDNIAEGLGNM